MDFSDRESEFLLKTLSDEYIKKNGENDKSIDEQRRELMLEAYNACMKHQLYKSFDPSPSLSLLTEEERKIVEERVAKTRSPLKEGFIGKEVKDNDKFLRKRMQDKNGVRIVNGFSGTTSRMLKTYKWLGLGSDFMNFRLGLMGWMLHNDDHSLWEIIIGSHNVGVKGKEDLTDIVSLDQTVDPLNESEIRKNVCEEYSDKGKMFPHEIVYYKQMFESNSDIFMGCTEEKEVSSRSGEMLRSRNEIAASNELKKQSEKLKREIEDIKQKLTLINEDKKKLFTNEEIQKIMTCLDNLKNFSQTFRNTSDELSIPAKPADFLTAIERKWGIAVKNGSVDEIINAANFMVNKVSSLKDEERTKGAYDIKFVI